MGVTFHDLGLEKEYLEMKPKVQATKKRLYQNSKRLCFKWYHQESEKIMHRMGEKSANHLSRKGLASRIQKKTVIYYIALFKSRQSFLAVACGIWKS